MLTNGRLYPNKERTRTASYTLPESCYRHIRSQAAAEGISASQWLTGKIMGIIPPDLAKRRKRKAADVAARQEQAANAAAQGRRRRG